MVNEIKTKKKSLRKILGLPVGSALFMSPNIEDGSYSDSVGDAGGVEEMLSYAKNVHEQILGGAYEVYDVLEESDLDEAEYQGKEVELNKPKSGGSKKYHVFVKDKKSNKIKKVSFGDPNMSIKRDNPKKRKSFRARHKCSTAKDKTTPRYWSCKFWSSTPVSKLLKEVISADNVDMSAIKTNEQLNQNIWDGENLRPEVRNGLLKNALMFVEYLAIPNLKIQDIILTGSLANYNYSDYSDLDVHILVDFNDIGSDIEIVRELMKEKKKSWNDTKDVKIKGYDVETFMQDTSEPTSIGGGVYSLYNNEWDEKPVKNIVPIDAEQVQVKSADYMNIIDSLETETDNKVGITKLSKLKDKLQKLRTDSLRKEGQYSLENLVYKVLKHTGYIDKLNALKNKFIEQELSVKENKLNIN